MERESNFLSLADVPLEIILKKLSISDIINALESKGLVRERLLDYFDDYSNIRRLAKLYKKQFIGEFLNNIEPKIIDKMMNYIGNTSINRDFKEQLTGEDLQAVLNEDILHPNFMEDDNKSLNDVADIIDNDIVVQYREACINYLMRNNLSKSQIDRFFEQINVIDEKNLKMIEFENQVVVDDLEFALGPFIELKSEYVRLGEKMALINKLKTKILKLK